MCAERILESLKGIEKSTRSTCSEVKRSKYRKGVPSIMVILKKCFQKKNVWNSLKCHSNRVQVSESSKSIQWSDEAKKLRVVNATCFIYKYLSIELRNKNIFVTRKSDLMHWKKGFWRCQTSYRSASDHFCFVRLFFSVNKRRDENHVIYWQNNNIFI